MYVKRLKDTPISAIPICPLHSPVGAKNSLNV